jgi:hypothetical protein
MAFDFNRVIFTPLLLATSYRYETPKNAIKTTKIKKKQKKKYKRSK